MPRLGLVSSLTGGAPSSTVLLSSLSTSFISTWTTTGSDEKVTIPFVSSGSIDFTIEWGDGNTDTVTAYDDNLGGGAIDHTYSSADTYTIAIGGTIRGLKFNNSGDKTKIKTITQWGTLDISTKAAFYGCSALTITATDAPTISTTDFDEGFQGCTSLTGIGDSAAEWDVSSVTTMGGMFYGTAFNQDIDDWDVGEVTYMGSMFGANAVFNQNLGSWDVTKCTNTSSMFNGCTSFAGGNIGNWGSKTGAVTSMNYMFYNCDAFNHDISSWDVSENRSTSNMFDGCHIFNQDIGGWDVGKVTTMRGTFNICTAFNQDLSDWDTSACTSMQTMFQQCTNYNQPMVTDGDKWNVSNVNTFNSMFANAQAFNQDLSTWDTSSVTDMQYMLYDTSFNQNIEAWTVAQVTNFTAFLQTTTTMSTANWNKFLIRIEATSSQSNKSLHGGSATATGDGAAARLALENDHGWTIVDGDG